MSKRSVISNSEIFDYLQNGDVSNIDYFSDESEEGGSEQEVERLCNQLFDYIPVGSPHLYDDIEVMYAEEYIDVPGTSDDAEVGLEITANVSPGSRPSPNTSTSDLLTTNDPHWPRVPRLKLRTSDRLTTTIPVPNPRPSMTSMISMPSTSTSQTDMLTTDISRTRPSKPTLANTDRLPTRPNPNTSTISSSSSTSSISTGSIGTRRTAAQIGNAIPSLTPTHCPVGLSNTNYVMPDPLEGIQLTEKDDINWVHQPFPKPIFENIFVYQIGIHKLRLRMSRLPTLADISHQI